MPNRARLQPSPVPLTDDELQSISGGFASEQEMRLFAIKVIGFSGVHGGQLPYELGRKVAPCNCSTPEWPTIFCCDKEIGHVYYDMFCMRCAWYADTVIEKNGEFRIFGQGYKPEWLDASKWFDGSN